MQSPHYDADNLTDLPDGLAAPARRALAGAGICSIAQLSTFTETQIRQLHGIGPNALKILEKALTDNGLEFARQK